MITRRDFLKSFAGVLGGISVAGLAAPELLQAEYSADFKISLAEWSFHRALFGGDMDHLDFARTAKNNYGIEAVEYVNQFFKDKANDQKYLQEMKNRADNEGVRSVLIMCDGEGRLGDPDDLKRTQAVENHYKWVEAAKFLGCHSIRVNAASEGSWDEQKKLAADGLRRLTDYADQHQINVIVENHGGLSSNADWLTSVIERVSHPRCGTLPDFGNFRIDKNTMYNPYEGVTKMMRFAKDVSAKSHSFDADGNEANLDYYRLMWIVTGSGYHEYVGIEYEGDQLSEADGVQATLKLLNRVQQELRRGNRGRQS